MSEFDALRSLLQGWATHASGSTATINAALAQVNAARAQSARAVVAGDTLHEMFEWLVGNKKTAVGDINGVVRLVESHIKTADSLLVLAIDRLTVARAAIERVEACANGYAEQLP